MASPFARFLMMIPIFVTGFIVFRWIDTHLTTMPESRLTQIMNEAQSGVR